LALTGNADDGFGDYFSYRVIAVYESPDISKQDGSEIWTFECKCGHIVQLTGKG
jgi:hypothetical protein